VYSDPEIQTFIAANFTPARFHVKEQPDAFPRFGAEWTPTILISSSEGKEHHRIEGFLPKDDFMGQLRLGLAHLARERGDFQDAEKRYRELAASAQPDLAAEALYWTGVSNYKRTGDGTVLTETARQMKARFADSTWMKKASVWEK
jgi:thioredoxin-related protein